MVTAFTNAVLFKTLYTSAVASGECPSFSRIVLNKHNVGVLVRGRHLCSKEMFGIPTQGPVAQYELTS